MRVELIDVTPEAAAVWLASNENNRSLNRIRVRSLAAAMRSGEWQVNGETIILSETGALLDGQHRLKAVTEYGRAVKMLVAFGASNESFKTIDTGKARSPGDILSISGHSSGTALAATSKIIWQMMHRQGLTVAVPPSYALKIIERFPSIQEYARKTLGMGKATIVPQSVLIAACVYLADVAKKPKLAASFFASVLEGDGLAAGSPILALRNRLIRARMGGARIDAKWAIPITMKAVSAYEQGKKAERFRLEQSSGAVEVPDLFQAHYRNLTPEEKLSDLLPPERVKDVA